jgi:hypothetical protein
MTDFPLEVNEFIANGTDLAVGRLRDLRDAVDDARVQAVLAVLLQQTVQLVRERFLPSSLARGGRRREQSFDFQQLALDVLVQLAHAVLGRLAERAEPHGQPHGATNPGRFVVHSIQQPLANGVRALECRLFAEGGKGRLQGPHLGTRVVGGHVSAAQQCVDTLGELGDDCRRAFRGSAHFAQRQLLDLILEELINRLTEFVLDVAKHLLNQRVDIQSNRFREAFGRHAQLLVCHVLGRIRAAARGRHGSLEYRRLDPG